MVYIVVLALTKASIISMYIHIFRSSVTFRRWSYAVLTLLVVNTATITPLTIVSCRPIQYFWDKDIKGGTCLDINALAYAHSGTAIVFDVIIITMPIGVLRQLNMPRRRKLQIGIMFAFGGLGLIATVLRLQSLLSFGNSLDPTVDYVPVVYWTTGELAAGIVCSSMPAIRKLLEKPLRSVVDSAKSRRTKASGATPLRPSNAWNRTPKSLSQEWSTASKSVGREQYKHIEATTPGVQRPPRFDEESGSDHFLPIQGGDEASDEVLRPMPLFGRIPKPRRVSAMSTSWI